MGRKRTDNEGARRTVGTRYPIWKIHLLDSLAERRGLRDRSTLIERALDRELEEAGLLNPKAMSRAA